MPEKHYINYKGELVKFKDDEIRVYALKRITNTPIF